MADIKASTRKAPVTGAANILRHDRIRAAIRLRLEGYTLEQIGDNLGVSTATICKDIKEAVDSIREQEKQLASQVLDMEIYRLNLLQVALHKTIFTGEISEQEPLDDHQLKAIDKMLKVMERRAKLLGLDAPTKIAATDTEGKGLTPENIAEVRKAVYGE